jgi:hypothetical protein
VCFHVEGGENVLLLLIALAMSCMMLLTTLMTKISNKALRGLWTRKVFETFFQNLLGLLKTLSES